MGNQKQKICYALEYKGDKTLKVKAIAKGCHTVPVKCDLNIRSFRLAVILAYDRTEI